MIRDALGQLDRGGIGHRAGADFGQRETGVVRRQDDVAGQGKLQPAAATNSVDGADHRLVEAGQFLQTAEAADAVIAIDLVAAGSRLQVPAGTEEFLTG